MYESGRHSSHWHIGKGHGQVRLQAVATHQTKDDGLLAAENRLDVNILG